MLKLMQDRGERQRGRHKNKSESARKGSRVEHLTNKQFLNALCCCLRRNALPFEVPYIYRSCMADGDVKKRGGRPKGRVKETVIVRMKGQRGVIDGQDRRSVHINYRLRAYAKACL